MLPPPQVIDAMLRLGAFRCVHWVGQLIGMRGIEIMRGSMTLSMKLA